jgi:hypothetical protein
VHSVDSSDAAGLMHRSSGPQTARPIRMQLATTKQTAPPRMSSVAIGILPGCGFRNCTLVTGRGRPGHGKIAHRYTGGGRTVCSHRRDDLNPMPCRYLIDREHGFVVSTAWDRVNFAEVEAHQDRLAKDPDFNPDYKQLVDATAVTGLDISIDEAKKIFGRKTFSSASQCAFLGKGLVVLGMGRLIEAQAAMMEGRETVRVFSERTKALKWLGMDNLPQSPA